MDWMDIFSESDTCAIVLVFSIPIVAIIVGGITAIVKMVFSHRERMTMIEQGIHPDYPPEEPEPEDAAVTGPDV